jgi:subtilisin family serine protease
MGLLKPDVAAPGSGTISVSWLDNSGYVTFGGTSAAAPHVGGAYCLLRQAHPELDTADLARAIQLGAVDLGDPGKDNIYGAGRIDIVASHELVPPVTILPPTDLVAFDTPGDAGGSIDLSWSLSPDDGGGNGLVEAYELSRTEQPGAYRGEPLAVLAAGTGAYQDTTVVDGREYYYRLHAVGHGLRSVPTPEVGPVVSMPNLPAAVEGGESAPRQGPGGLVAGANPFWRSTVIRFELAAAEEVELAVYDVAGKRVRTLVRGVLPAALHRVAWDGRDAGGQDLPSGLYLLELEGATIRSSHKVLKLR